MDGPQTKRARRRFGPGAVVPVLLNIFLISAILLGDYLRGDSGDDVVVVKDLPVKGAPKPVKAGTKVKNIRLAEGDHNIDCRIDGFGSMALKSEFVKKA